MMANDSALLLRGEDRYGHFRTESRAVTIFVPDLVAFQAEVARALAGEINSDDTGRLVNAEANT